MPKQSCYPFQPKVPIVCVYQIVLQHLEELAGVSTVLPLYPDVIGLSMPESLSKCFSDFSLSHFNQKKILILIFLLFVNGVVCLKYLWGVFS